MIYTPRTILITGGAGFIGANFVRCCLAQVPNVKLLNLDALTYAGTLANLCGIEDSARYQFINGDINDPVLLQTIFQQYQIDTVVHFAAESHVDRSIANPAAFIQTNLVGTFNLLETARHYWQTQGWSASQCRFHHVSTDEVYGALTATAPAFTEQSPYAPNSPYAASKAGSDHLARAYFHTYQLPITVSNCSNNYGPYQHREKLIPTIINNCFARQAIPLYGDGSHVRDWLYVADHCTAIWQIITRGKIGETYNIGGNNEWSNLQLVKMICALMDELYPQTTAYADLITQVADRPGHDWRYAIDNTKIQTQLNWQPTMALRAGLIETITHYAALIKQQN